MKQIFSSILLVLFAAVATYSGFQIYEDMQKDQQLGVSIPQGSALFETILQSPITDSATSMTLASNSLRGGGSLSGFNCFVIDEGSSQTEFVCGTVSGTSVTDMTRGISPENGTSSVDSLKYSHRRGANVKITDFPLIQILRNLSNGVESYPNLLSYDQGTECVAGSASTTICNKQYMDNLANQGAATSTESLAGIVELATVTEAASSTDLGSNRPLVLQAKYATTSPDTTTTPLVVMSQIGGKIKQAWLDLSESFTWTGAHTFSSTATFNDTATFNATSTMATTTATDLTVSGTTTTANLDVTGNLSLSETTTIYDSGKTTVNAQSVSTTTISHDLGRVPKRIKITTMYGEATNQQHLSHGVYTTNGGQRYIGILYEDNFTGTGIAVIGDSDSDHNIGTLENITSSQFEISWSTTGSPDSQNHNLLWEIEG